MCMGNVQEIYAASEKSLLCDQIVTVGHLQDFKQDLLASIKRLLEASAANPVKKWLKSYEVEKLLDISPGTLQTLRNNGTLPYTKIGSIIYYDPQDIEKVLQEKKVIIRNGNLPAFRR